MARDAVDGRTINVVLQSSARLPLHNMKIIFIPIFRRQVALTTTLRLSILPLSCCRRCRHCHTFQLFLAEKGKHVSKAL